MRAHDRDKLLRDLAELCPRAAKNGEVDNRPLPTQPPYTAFCGNIWGDDINESGLAAIFSDLKVKSVKVMRDKDHKSRGFGFVEFEDRVSLKAALQRTWQHSLGGRLVRVKIADPPKERPTI
ncbi:eukaryotic translation initiation factor 4H [Pisolithus orientalis]|uniref:eukaryotic translation initiation factor 4H n=1 Tax=Pisolithus orientalis TaxID=936130 RepID=UPI0022245760|nr:eukaryotic translation initiation factor 4H [Pisolithus orientalis]KAI5985121.1 eukaryotic translation initiation factor 4H [Pisolithus orientalis]